MKQSFELSKWQTSDSRTCEHTDRSGWMTSQTHGHHVNFQPHNFTLLLTASIQSGFAHCPLYPTLPGICPSITEKKFSMNVFCIFLVFTPRFNLLIPVTFINKFANVYTYNPNNLPMYRNTIGLFFYQACFLHLCTKSMFKTVFSMNYPFHNW